MPRRVNGQPVENEERVAVAALRLCNLTASGEARFWVNDILAQLEVTEPGLGINASTVNRALNHLVVIGWMWAAWETADPGDRLSSKPRLYFRFTDEGLKAAKSIVVSRRRALPVWVLYPREVLGEEVEEPRLAVRRPEHAARKPRARPARAPGGHGQRERAQASRSR